MVFLILLQLSGEIFPWSQRIDISEVGEQPSLKKKIELQWRISGVRRDDKRLTSMGIPMAETEKRRAYSPLMRLSLWCILMRRTRSVRAVKEPSQDKGWRTCLQLKLGRSTYTYISHGPKSTQH